MEETNLYVLYKWYQDHSFCLVNTHKTSVTSFICAQKQAKKQNQKNLRKGRLCPWCWPNMQLTIHSIIVSSATSIWTSIPLHRLVSRSKGKLLVWFFRWFLQSFPSGLRTQAFTFPEMELFNSSILRGDIELQMLEHQLCLLRCVWAEFSSPAAPDKGWILWLFAPQPGQRVFSISWEITVKLREMLVLPPWQPSTPGMGDWKAPSSLRM